MEGFEKKVKPCPLCTEVGSVNDMSSEELYDHFIYHFDPSLSAKKVNEFYSKHPTPPTVFVCDCCRERTVVLNDEEKPTNNIPILKYIPPKSCILEPELCCKKCNSKLGIYKKNK